MKKWILVTMICCLLAVGAAGCPEWLVGAGAGAASIAALDATEQSLITTGAELDTKIIKAEQQVKDASTPEELSLAKKKLAVLGDQKLANLAAIHTVQSIKAVAGEQTPEARQDAVIVGALGLVSLAVREWQKRTLNKKYVSMKAGQARLKTVNPEAEKQLYTLTGEARAAAGL